MKRKEFIRSSCMLCIGTAAGLSLLESCSSTRYVNGTISNGKLQVPLKEFTETGKKGETRELSQIVVRNDSLKSPIGVYRHEGVYEAVWMSCTHQGAELHWTGKTYHCPAHGSDFSQLGEVMQGPADKNLRRFRTQTDAENLYILLEK